MLIRGEADGACIELSEREGLSLNDGSEFYRVTLRENEFEASIRVYAFDPSDNGLPKFFSNLASDWKGWDGPRGWKSLEGEFELMCRHDGVGHIETTARLHSIPYGYGWTAEIRFDIAPGDLERIAADVGRFFSARSLLNCSG
jgi:hypothetical protein